MIRIKRHHSDPRTEGLHSALAGERDDAILRAFDIRTGNGAPAVGRQAHDRSPQRFRFGHQPPHRIGCDLGRRQLREDLCSADADDHAALAARGGRRELLVCRVGRLAFPERRTLHAIGQHHGTNIDQCVDRLGRDFGSPADNDATSAVAGQYHGPLRCRPTQVGDETGPAIQRDRRQAFVIRPHARQIGRDHMMALRLQYLRNAIETPAAVPGAMNQYECRHCQPQALTWSAPISARRAPTSSDAGAPEAMPAIISKPAWRIGKRSFVTIGISRLVRRFEMAGSNIVVRPVIAGQPAFQFAMCIARAERIYLIHMIGIYCKFNDHAVWIYDIDRAAIAMLEYIRLLKTGIGDMLLKFGLRDGIDVKRDVAKRAGQQRRAEFRLIAFIGELKEGQRATILETKETVAIGSLRSEQRFLFAPRRNQGQSQYVFIEVSGRFQILHDVGRVVQTVR